MARGGHHGGGGHHGSHHSGGFGGHSGGGLFGGGGYHGGSGYSNEAGILKDIIDYSIIGFVLIIFILFKISEGAVPGLDLINLGIFCLSVPFFVFGLKEYKRTAALNGFKKLSKPVYTGKVWKGREPFFRSGDKHTWVGKYEDWFCISFSDNEFAAENAGKVKDTMKRTPAIIWMNPFVWLVIGVISFINTFWFYEAVIPFFEQATMTDEAFAFMDDFIFYLPAAVTLLCSIACYAFMRIKDNLLYKLAGRIVADNTAAEERLKTQEFISSELSQKWYYNVCPNCGAKASNDLRSCASCGTSLEVPSESAITSAVHQISYEAEEENA